MLLLALLAVLHVTRAADCGFSADDGDYDLSSLKNGGVGYKFSYEDGGSEFEMQVSICEELTDSTCDSGTTVCQEWDSGHKKVAALEMTFAGLGDGDEGVLLTMEGGEEGSGTCEQNAAALSMVCDHGHTGPPEFEYIGVDTTDNICTYELKVTTDAACIGGGGGGGGSLLFGTEEKIAAIVIFFTFGLVAIAVGTAKYSSAIKRNKENGRPSTDTVALLGVTAGRPRMDRMSMGMLSRGPRLPSMDVVAAPGGEPGGGVDVPATRAVGEETAALALALPAATEDVAASPEDNLSEKERKHRRRREKDRARQFVPEQQTTVEDHSDDYERLFQRCVGTDANKVSRKAVGGLLKNVEDVPYDRVKEYWKKADVSCTNDLGRGRFFIALRLLSLHQEGLPPTLRTMENYPGGRDAIPPPTLSGDFNNFK